MILFFSVKIIKTIIEFFSQKTLHPLPSYQLVAGYARINMYRVWLIHGAQNVLCLDLCNSMYTGIDTIVVWLIQGAQNVLCPVAR